MAGAVVMLQARRGGGPWRDVAEPRRRRRPLPARRGSACSAARPCGCGGPTSAARSGAGSRPLARPHGGGPVASGAIAVRAAAPADYDRVAPLVDEWWGGRAMIDMLPRLFFVHFAETAFVAEDGDEPRAAHRNAFVFQGLL